MKATIYTLPNCPWCVRAKKLMDRLGWEYKEVQQKHESWPTVPYVEVEGKGIGGFTELAGFLRKRIS